jgi:hypothetical protein
MKIAVCFSGQLRTGTTVSPNILRYIGALLPNCDFFVHTWDQQSVPHGANYTFEPIDPQILSEFYQTYQPLAMVVEPYDLRPISPIWSGYRVDSQGRNLVSMFESIYEANKLKSTHEQKYDFNYDLVVRIRPDIVFRADKSLAEDIKLVIDPNMFVYGAHKGDFGMTRLEDIFWIGTSSVLDKICDFVEYRADSGIESDWQFHMADWVRDTLKIRFRALDNNYMRIYYQTDINKGIDPLNPTFGDPPGSAGSPYA